MSAALLLGVTGLALLDSLNPATMLAVTLILLAAPNRPALTALAAVLGAALTVFTLGAALFLTAGAAAAAVDGIVIALRYIAFGAAGAGLFVAGIRRFTNRPRRVLQLPPWFSARTALAFGALITAADLPNAFPYFIAIERLVDADISIGQGLLTLAGYTLIYCLPCLILLAVGVVSQRRTRAWLVKLSHRFGTGVVMRSVPIAVLLIIAAIAVASIPIWIGTVAGLATA